MPLSAATWRPKMDEKDKTAVSRLETVSHIHWCMELRLTSCRITAVLIALSLWPLAAEAQDKVGISLSAGVLSARDSAPLGEFQRPLLAVSIQRVFWDHFVVEGELTHWTYLRHLEFGPRNVIGQQGVIGSVTGGEVNNAHSYWNYGLNLLLKSTGRVRVFGGAGLGLSYDNNDYSQQSFGCSPSLAAATCDRFTTHYDRGGFIVRALGGVEVPITSRVGVVGSLRGEKTNWEDASNWLSATAGVRFAF